MKKRYSVALFLIFSIIMLLLTIIPSVAKYLNGYDLFLHLIGFFILTISLIIILTQFEINNILVISFFLLIFISIISEIIQIPIPNRNFEFKDLLLDFIGIILGFIVNHYSSD
jgi:VanZ family protein